VLPFPCNPSAQAQENDRVKMRLTVHENLVRSKRNGKLPLYIENAYRCIDDPVFAEEMRLAREQLAAEMANHNPAPEDMG
jgi:hypothetical protein